MKRRVSGVARCVALAAGAALSMSVWEVASAATPFVNGTADGSANDVGQYSSLALDAQGNPHVSYYGQAGLEYARKSGGAWLAPETADGSVNYAGLSTSLALDAQGNPHVSYYDDTTGDLKYAWKSGGVWTTETADGSANNEGEYTSLALDAQGNPHVSYHDATTGDLKYTHAAVRTLTPLSGVTWAVGSRQTVTWSGLGTVSLLLSIDGGRTFEPLIDGVTDNAISLRVPHAPTRFARIRVERAEPFSTSDTDSFFTINEAISLSKFEARPAGAERGVALSWKTSPGPEADVRYRVERAAEGGAFAPAHAGLLAGEEYADAAGVMTDRYRLIAVNGLDEEYAMGEAAVAPALAADRDLSVAPNPALGGVVRFVFRVPAERPPGEPAPIVDLRVFDASGRQVRRVASGIYPGGVQSILWNGQDDQGRDVAMGTYFARLSWGGGASASERLVIVR